LIATGDQLYSAILILLFRAPFFWREESAFPAVDY
jgi:hypothetical protein